MYGDNLRLHVLTVSVDNFYQDGVYDEFVRLATERAKKRKVKTKSLILPILNLSKIKPLSLIISKHLVQ